MDRPKHQMSTPAIITNADHYRKGSKYQVLCTVYYVAQTLESGAIGMNCGATGYSLCDPGYVGKLLSA